MNGGADLVAVYLRWIWWRALLHRGWWLVTSVYLVVDAELSPSQLVVIGVAQGLVAVVFEVPAGVVADTIGRKRSLIVSHALMGTAMLATGLVTDFEALVATQMLWGLAWTFASGADVAWITDELDSRRASPPCSCVQDVATSPGPPRASSPSARSERCLRVARPWCSPVRRCCSSVSTSCCASASSGSCRPRPAAGRPRGRSSSAGRRSSAAPA